MSRVLVVGHGPARGSGAEHISAHGLRTWHVARTLQQEGHAVVLVALRSAHTEAWPARRVRRTVHCGVTVIDVSEHLPRDNPQWLRREFETHGPELWVGVGLDGCVVAAEMCADLPMFADLNGAPFAEAQAKAKAVGHDRWTAGVRARFLPVLRRADRFTACSPLQRGALIGQLGLVGRLGSEDAATELVHVIGNGLDEEELEALLTQPQAHDGFEVLLSGGFNTWFDEDTAYRVLSEALSTHPELRVRVLGGGIDGHYTRGFERFEAKVLAGPHTRRIRRVGWVPATALPAHYAEVDAALLCDRPGYEGELGARTRVLDWLAAGLPVVMTRLSAISRELEREGAALTASPGDSDALLAHLDALLASPARTLAMGRAARTAAEARRIDRLMAPLLTFARRPERARSTPSPAGRLGLRGQLAARVDEAGWHAAMHDVGRWLRRRVDRRPPIVEDVPAPETGR